MYYNFFSAQDIKSWISSKAIMTGLVTDGLWILIRSDKTRKDIENLVDSQITEFLEERTCILEYIEQNLIRRHIDINFCPISNLLYCNRFCKISWFINTISKRKC